MKTKPTTEQRRSEAQGLRQLFSRQLDYIRGLVEGALNKQSQSILERAPKFDAVENMVTGTDKRIRALSGYKNRLREAIGTTLSYIDKAIECLPESVLVDKNSFLKNSSINAFFVNVDDIKYVFSSSHELQSFFSKNENISYGEAYAILFVNRDEKHVLGKAINNNLLVGDVKQTVVNFSKHEVVAPCVTEELARKALEEFVFNQIVEYVSLHMAGIRRQQNDLLTKEHPEACVNGLCNPEVYLDELIAHLVFPNPLLSCKKKELRLNKMGILVDNNSIEAVNEFTAHEFRIGEQPARVVMIVKYPRDGMLPDTSLF